MNGAEDCLLEMRRVETKRMLRSFSLFSSLRGKDDLTDWILTFQGTGKATADYALQKWSETGSLSWLIASLTKIDPAQPQSPALLGAAEKIPPDSPAFLTIAFHRARLLIAAGEKGQARDFLDGLLFSRNPELPLAARNLFLALRMPLARNLNEWLNYALRVPIDVFYDGNGLELPPFEDDENGLELPTSKNKKLQELVAGRAFFDADATQALNLNLPLSLLVDAVASKALPDHLRRELALAAWVRAAVLEDAESGERLAPMVASLIDCRFWSGIRGVSRRYRGLLWRDPRSLWRTAQPRRSTRAR